MENATYPTTAGSFVDVKFNSITARCLRAVFDASGDEQQHAAVAVQEWEALAPKEISPVKLRKLSVAGGSALVCSGASSEKR